ncbi:hypothetical protein ACIBEJ_01285 [Nonomuraea sp. NPDC050790]|uniref:hypothetical protein n=1 Tax=Nonomuraea sp. NPDC050790 TaxID=3364371 RepID=UPI0037A87872
MLTPDHKNPDHKNPGRESRDHKNPHAQSPGSPTSTTHKLTTRWLPGPHHPADTPLLVSETDFRLHHIKDLPRACWAGWRLSRLWPGLEGAVALLLWADPLRRRIGSVSVWRSADDLDRFVRLRAHADIVRAYRGKGTLTTRTWESIGVPGG